MTARLDLNVRHWAKQRHELMAVGTWINIEGRQKPCMVLFRAGVPYDRIQPYVITGDKAWVWSEDIGDPANAARQCFAICEQLNLEPTEKMIFRIVGFVNDHLGDLLTIPPYPPVAAPANVIAELVITNRSTGEAHEVAINDV